MSKLEPLKDYVFVFTGELSISREEAQGKVLILGGRFTTALSNKTTHLVTGNEPGMSKLAKAKLLGTKIMNEKDFLELLSKFEMKEEVTMSTNIENNPNIKEIENEASDSTFERNDQHSEYTNSSQIDLTQIPSNEQSWVEKYRPQTRKEFVGNPSALEQLNEFIQGNVSQNAALLSGSPGVGKTTAAHMLCKEQGYEILEFNASDLRSKGSLLEQIAPFIKSYSLNKNLKIGKRIIIMDEVDGMSSDRGGIPELVNMIKKTKTRFICICNDAVHIKMRTLANHCFDIKFRKLDSRTILPKVKEILMKENKKLPDGIINDVIMNGNGDMRYILNTIQNMVSKDTISIKKASETLVKKTVSKNTFELVSEMFQPKSIDEKTDIFFQDYSIMPLFVHENYLKGSFTDINQLAQAAESISFSNLLDARIHGSEQDWSLLPFFGFYSCVYPTRKLKLNSRIDFTSYLGNVSKTNKHMRFLNEIVYHCSRKCSRSDIRLYYAEIIYKKLCAMLESGDIQKCTACMKDLNITREDLVNIEEVLHKDLFKKVPTKTKTAFTKECKKIQISAPSLPGFDGDDSEEQA